MRIDEHSQRVSVGRLRKAAAPRVLSGSALLLVLIAVGTHACERREILSPRVGQTAQAPARETNARSAEADSVQSVREAVNRAVRVEVVAVEEPPDSPEAKISGDDFLLVKTLWTNIHPRQMVAKSKLEGQADRTMGVGALTRGGGAEEEMVEVDIAYRVPRWIDHVYLLADGLAHPLHEPGGKTSAGVDPSTALEISEHGEVVEADLLFVAPRGAKHLALRLFDYGYGHITIPIRGRGSRAIGDGEAPRQALAVAAAGSLQLAALGVDLQSSFHGRPASTGYRWAVVALAGKSLSSGPGTGNIVEIDPRGYLWLTTDGGFLRYAEAPELLRFTPEIFQRQEVAFALPNSAERFALGARVGNEVVQLPLTDREPNGLPDPVGRHLDGGAMEVQLFGSRREGELVVLDLCVRPLAKARGLEIRPAAQLLLRTGTSEATVDARATAALRHPPPEPFVVPPDTPVRFEIAFRTRNTPEALRIRGFESEGRIGL